MTNRNAFHDPQDQRLFEQNKPLVEKIARNMARKLSANIECDDLIQDGMIGLLDAILRNSKNTTSAQFENYAAQRARGAMLDGLRAGDPCSRQMRRSMRQVELVILQLGHQLGRAPLESEVANNLAMPLADYQRLLQEAHGYTLISIDDLGGDDDPHGYLAQCADSSHNPLVVLERASLRKALTKALKTLSKQGRLLLNLYYVHDMKMHEIGKALKVSESRVSQLHTQAIAQLRAGFANHQDILKPRRKQRFVA